MGEHESALWMLDASIFQLRSGSASIEDAMTAMPLRLALDVLTSAIAGAREGLNAARVNEIAFAMNDVDAAAGELSASDFELVAAPIEALKKDIEVLKAATSLPQPLVSSVRALQAKLKERRAAIERQTMVEGASVALPHDPQQLSSEAIPIRDQLIAAGFATPALDTFIGDPSSLRFHSINDIVDELDVIVG